MRFVFAIGLAIALWLNFPAAGMAARQQAPAPSANSGEQAAPAPIPAESAPDAGKKAAGSVAKEKRDAGPASAITKRHKRIASAPVGAPRKIVVREGGASEPAAQIAPGMPSEEAARQRRNVEQLLNSTDDELKPLAGRALKAQQQEMVGQTRNYMDGARSALKEGDLRRASTLAEKAHLLADDLLKHSASSD